MPIPLATTPGRTVTLYDRPTIQQFSKAQGVELARQLKELDNTTTIYPISDEAEFQLTGDGRTKSGGYRFTSFAFSQIAQIIAPGLSKLLPDISGSIVLSEDRQFLVDSALSIDFWNRLIDLRFATFRNYRIIRNDKDKLIEGVIGTKHQYLENLALLTAANETLADYRPDVKFFAAVIVGRRMAVWYRSAAPAFVVDVDGQPWPFFVGYYFTNGEATGTSVRGTLAVFSREGLCLGPYKQFGERVTHAGREFYQRLGQMLITVITKEIPVTELRHGAEALLTTTLGFTTDMDKQARRQQHRKLAHSLGIVGIPKKLASDIVKRGLTRGRSLGKANFMPLQDVGRVYPRRTLLDLWVPVMHAARAVDLSRREILEQAAFEVLLGRIMVPRSNNSNGTSVA